MNNTMTIRDTSMHALAQAKPTVLGEAQARIPIGGRIRSGIKVLIGKYRDLKTVDNKTSAQEIYDRGVKAGAEFDLIDKTIISKCFKDKPPYTTLTPRNVPYFTVRPGDFTSPGAAALLMEKYATDGEQGRQLYRFPVIFPMDNWQAVMPHDFACYTAGERRFWSEYGPDGQRFCMTHAELPIETVMIKGKQVKQPHRPAGGRQTIRRPDNEGLCNPDLCPQYQARECGLTGRLIFYVPGLPGTSAIELPTRSFYSLSQIRQTLEMVAFITGGKISGTFNGEPVFWLTKRQQEVSMIDPATGKAKRVNQFLIALESTIDMTRMFQAAEGPALLAAGAQAAAVLSGPAHIDHSFGDDGEPPQRPAAAAAATSSAAATPEGGAPLSVDDMLAAIASATDGDTLNDVLDMVRGLNDEAAAQVREAAGVRAAELEASA